MQFKDYYKILGVEENADQDVVKKRFRELARRYHPDVNKDNKEAEAKFKEVTEAYEVLGDVEKRKKYDDVSAGYDPRAGAGFRNGFGTGFGAGFGADFGAGNGNGNRYGNGRGGGYTRPGGFDDIGADSFSDFFHFIFERDGAHARPSSDLHAELPLGPGEILRGDKVVVEVGGEKLEVRVPRGIRGGSTLKVAGRGAVGPEGERGDLLLKVHERPHGVYKRRGDNLHREANIDLYTALLGGNLELETLDGRVDLKVPPESKPGILLRLKGRGMPHPDQPDVRGDMLVELRVDFPEDLTPEEKELLGRLAELRK